MYFWYPATNKFFLTFCFEYTFFFTSYLFLANIDKWTYGLDFIEGLVPTNNSSFTLVFFCYKYSLLWQIIIGLISCGLGSQSSRIGENNDTIILLYTFLRNETKLAWVQSYYNYYLVDVCFGDSINSEILYYIITQLIRSK